VVLSQETAVGAYSMGAVAMISAIAELNEKTLDYNSWDQHRVHRSARDTA